MYTNKLLIVYYNLDRETNLVIAFSNSDYSEEISMNYIRKACFAAVVLFFTTTSIFADDDRAKIKSVGLLKVGTEGTYAPFTYHNASGALIVRSDETKIKSFAVRKGNPELLAAINKALADAKADGSFARISKKYFEEDVTK
jgi:ABC-type amino acid transport substrate-binding protein